MKERAPAFQFYPKDWLSEPKLRGLPLVVKGAYIELLAICWMERTLPADSEELRRLAGATEEEWNICSTSVASLFNSDPENPERLFHSRLEDEREKHRQRREQTSKAGRASGLARRKPGSPPVLDASNDRSTSVEQNGNPSSSSSTPSSSSPCRVLRAPEGGVILEKQKRPPKREAEKPDDVSQDLWDDWLTHRRAVRAPVTETVMARISNQAEKAGIPVSEALEFTAAMGWRGFSAEWYEREKSRKGKPTHISQAAGRMDFGDDPIQDF